MTDRFLVAMLLVAIGGVAATHLDHHKMTDRDIVDEGYSEAVVALYRGLFDKLVTNPPGDEKEATANFERGVIQARKARAIALESIKKD